MYRGERLDYWADCLDAAVNETAACQDRDNEGAAALLSAVALLAESARALYRGDLEASADHNAAADALLKELRQENVALRPTRPKGNI